MILKVGRNRTAACAASLLALASSTALAAPPLKNVPLPRPRPHIVAAKPSALQAATASAAAPSAVFHTASLAPASATKDDPAIAFGSSPSVSESDLAGIKHAIDLARRVAHRRDGRDVRLTPLEHRILETLARYGDRIVTHAALIREVWGPHRDDSRALRVYIGSLRRKLEVDPSRPKHILTELGVGYRLVISD